MVWPRLGLQQAHHALGCARIAPVCHQQAARKVAQLRRTQLLRNARPELTRAQAQVKHRFIGTVQLGHGAEHARRSPRRSLGARAFAGAGATGRVKHLHRMTGVA